MVKFRVVRSSSEAVKSGCRQYHAGNLPSPTIIFWSGGGGIVKEVTGYQHLGVILSSNLSWNEHIHVHDICLKASERLDILRALKYKLSRQALELIYLSFIHPIIEYGDVLFDGCGEINNAKLNKIQFGAAKIVSGAMYGTSSVALLKDLG